MAGKVLWGAASSGGHYENELVFGYGFFDPVSDREPREGSEFVQFPSGAEDAWLTGRDFTLTLQARLIPDSESTAGGADGLQRTGLSDPGGWQEFLDYGRNKGDFRFVPNSAYPDFYVDTCYLVEPLRGFGQNNSILQRDLTLKIRSSKADFNQAIKGVAFAYRPGALTTGAASDPTFSRSGPANSVGHALGIVQSSSGVLRDRNYESTGLLRTTLLEGARTNVCLRSEDFGASTVWSVNGTPTLTSGAYTRLGGVTLDLIGDDSTAALEGYQQSIVFSTDGAQGVSIFFRQDNSTGFRFDIYDATAGINRLVAFVYLSTNSTAAPTMSAGALQRLRAFDDKVYRLETITTTGLVAANNNLLRTFPATDVGASANYTGRIYAGGAQCEPSFVTSYLKSVSTAATRNVDGLSWSLPAGFAKPQASWWYAKFVELGTIELTGARIFELSATASTPPRLLMQTNTTGIYRFYHEPTSSGGGEVAVQTTALALAMGDTVELLGLLYADGSIQLKYTINSSAELASAQSAVPSVRAFGSTWSGTTISFGQIGGSAAGFAGFANFKCGPGTTVNTIASARIK